MAITLQEIRKSLPLRVATGHEWAEGVLANLDSFLADHASCERKAHAAALMLVNRFPGNPEFQDIMIGLAIEELEHFRQVVAILRSRNVPIPADETDPYVKTLLTHVRHPQQEHILDRLLVVAMVEARSCERFCLLAEALPEGDLKNFYIDFALAEGRHFPLMTKAASLLFPEPAVNARLEEWLTIEAEVMRSLPYRPAVH